MTRPTVSILMSVKDGERHIREAIDSLLGQRLQDFELIVVDDASDDATAAILRSYRDPRLKVLANPMTRGLTVSLNSAAEHARGLYIARQDADDRSHPDRLAVQVSYLDEHASTTILGSAYNEIDEAGKLLRTHRQPRSDTAIRWQLLFHNAFCHSSVMLRSDAVERPIYDPAFRFSQDYEAWARLVGDVRGENLEEPLVDLRVHGRRISARQGSEQARFAISVSKRQIEDVAPHLQLSGEDISTLRRWYNRRPAHVDEGQERLVRSMLELAHAFSSCPDVDSAIAERLVDSWERWAVVATTPRSRERLVADGLITLPRAKRILVRGKARLRRTVARRLRGAR